MAKRKTSKGAGTPELSPAKISGFKRLVTDLALLGLSSILFALAFPNFLAAWGFFPLGFIALVPIFPVIRRAGWLRVILYGGLYNYLSYLLFNFWLAKFHPLAIFIVPTIYFVYGLLLFPALKMADRWFPNRAYLVQAVVWVGYEYLRSQGFLGYQYGNLGYAPYLMPAFIRIASITGLWGVSFLTVLPSTFLGHALISGFRGFGDFVRRHRIDGMVYAGVIVFVVIFGLVVKADFSETPRLRAALVQQNVDPWKGGIEAYERNLEILIRQSDRALEEDPEIVIWSETSFVPGIDWHRRYRTNRRSYQLVKRLTDYLDTKDVPFVIGNDDGRLEVDELTGERGRVDYNATILYDEGEIQEIYRKVHLVPFTEYFPYRGILTGIYHWLKNADTHFWKEGDEYTVFEAAGVQFSTPICFEDTFGYISRNFVRNGADLIVNMTNDSWSFSVAAEMQHMAMSVMRAVENRRSVVRSTNGGITCTIDANGKIRTTLEPFIEGYLVDEVPVYTEDDTIYTRWGEWFGLLMLFGGLGLLVLGAVLRLTKRNN